MGGRRLELRIANAPLAAPPSLFSSLLLGIFGTPNQTTSPSAGLAYRENHRAPIGVSSLFQQMLPASPQCRGLPRLAEPAQAYLISSLSTADPCLPNPLNALPAARDGPQQEQPPLAPTIATEADHVPSLISMQSRFQTCLCKTFRSPPLPHP